MTLRVLGQGGQDLCAAVCVLQVQSNDVGQAQLRARTPAVDQAHQESQQEDRDNQEDHIDRQLGLYVLTLVQVVPFMALETNEKKTKSICSALLNNPEKSPWTPDVSKRDLGKIHTLSIFWCLKTLNVATKKFYFLVHFFAFVSHWNESAVCDNWWRVFHVAAEEFCPTLSVLQNILFKCVHISCVYKEEQKGGTRTKRNGTVTYCQPATCHIWHS